MTTITETTPSTSSALRTDRYELTMLEGALKDGTAHRRAIFEVFARSLPDGRRYGVVAGTGRLLDELRRFRFNELELAYLKAEGFAEITLNFLRDYRFSCTVDGYREGDLFFPYSPILTIEGSFADALIVETLVLSVLNGDCAIASAASRIGCVATGRTLIEGGGRRVHEKAAPDVARAAYIGGFDVTSNLEAGRLYGIPTAGTAAHAWILAHDSEREAFDAQIAAFGPNTTLLIDTYDIPEGIKNAVAAARAVGATGPGAIRIDSGDLTIEIPAARAQLDGLGATSTKITVSGDLDEYMVDDLGAYPVDGYLVGTKLVTGCGAPTAGLVYKLVAITNADGTWRPVAKKSASKATVGGRKVAYRLCDEEGFAHEEQIVAGDIPENWPIGRPLQVRYLQDGVAVEAFTLDEARAHHRIALAELRPFQKHLTSGPSAVRTVYPGGVQ